MYGLKLIEIPTIDVSDYVTLKASSIQMDLKLIRFWAKWKEVLNSRALPFNQFLEP